jgi:hypothetical protein
MLTMSESENGSKAEEEEKSADILTSQEELLDLRA